MAQTSSKRPLLATFTESLVESAQPPDFLWSLKSRGRPLEDQINEWASQHGIVDYSTTHSSSYSPIETLPDGSRERTLTVTCVVKYVEVPQEKSDFEMPVNEPPLALKPGATAPTVEVMMVMGPRRCLAYAMAGVFGVPEGHKFHPDDNEPAPVPLFSPDLDLSPYRLYFGNIGEHRGKDALHDHT